MLSCIVRENYAAAFGKAGCPVITSPERQALAYLKACCADIPGLAIYSGQGKDNRVAIPSWSLGPQQCFQYGDLRFESPAATIIVEVESAGGVTNLAKYWPFLREARLSKRLVLAHLFQIGASGDYASHRKLWAFICERMRLDLQCEADMVWRRDWDARLFCYGQVNDLDAACAYVHAACS